MLAFSHWGAQKSHRATPDTLDTRMDALIMDRCRSEQDQIRSPKHRTSAISMTYAAMPADESRWRYHGKRFVPPKKPGREQHGRAYYLYGAPGTQKTYYIYVRQGIHSLDLPDKPVT
jgi:hypothetical protein